MSIKPICFIIVSFFALMIPSLSAFGASDGTLGATSTGTTDVSLTISSLVKISNISDLTFGTYGGSGDAMLDDNVCVWTNQSSGIYKVKAIGNGAGSAFTVANGGATMPYSVKWNNTNGTTGSIALTTNVYSASLTGASTTSTSCAGGTNANFQVKFLQSDLLSVRPGTFTGVLTLLVAPAA